MIGFDENVGSGFPKIIAAWKETNWGEPQLLNKLDVDEVELVMPVPSPKSSNIGLYIKPDGRYTVCLPGSTKEH
jgi:hypothetical protein